MQNQTPPLILTFNASDPVAAVGLQADLATCASMSCHALSVTTALLAADTARVEDIFPIDADWLNDQARLLLEDMPIAAFKVGIVGSIENVTVIAEIVSDYPEAPLILDPFSSQLPVQEQDGDDLLHAICELLVPQATILTLSQLELERLSESWADQDTSPSPEEETTEAVAVSADIVQHPGSDLLAERVAHLIELGCEYVLISDIDHPGDEAGYCLFDQSGLIWQQSSARPASRVAGSGSTLSAATACMLAIGVDLPDAVIQAHQYMIETVRAAQRLGMGKLVPDRYFWATPDEPGLPGVSDNAGTSSGDRPFERLTH